MEPSAQDVGWAPGLLVVDMRSERATVESESVDAVAVPVLRLGKGRLFLALFLRSSRLH